jgi:hypothetical protein
MNRRTRTTHDGLLDHGRRRWRFFHRLSACSAFDAVEKSIDGSTRRDIDELRIRLLGDHIGDLRRDRHLLSLRFAPRRALLWWGSWRRRWFSLNEPWRRWWSRRKGHLHQLFARYDSRRRRGNGSDNRRETGVDHHGDSQRRLKAFSPAFGAWLVLRELIEHLV